MATTFKNLSANDVTSTRTLLHESIPITGTIVSGTYVNDGNIKNYAHGMFQSVYDYPYLSSSANHIFDITVGYAPTSVHSSSVNVQNAKKINIYNQMAQVLMGHDVNGSIREFDEDGDIAAGGTKIKEAIFLCFSRLLVKDEIKKGSFVLHLLTGGTIPTPTGQMKITDSGAISAYNVNSPAGEYGVLFDTTGGRRGLIFYQAGIAVISSSVFQTLPGTALDNRVFGPNDLSQTFDSSSFNAVLTGSEISSSADGVRNRFNYVSFNNTTELNSTIYFCRANHNEFNYSSNPTYTNASKLRVKDKTTDEPASYITTVGLYSADNELLAVAKLSEPIKKTPSTEYTLRLRLDF